MGLYLATRSSRGIVNTKIVGMWLKMELGAGESPLTNKDTAIGSRCRPLEAGRFELNASLEGSTGAPLERNATVERSALLADAKISTVRQDLGYLPVAPFDSRCPRSVARAGYFSAQECGAVGAGFASMEYETSGEHSSLGSARARRCRLTGLTGLDQCAMKVTLTVIVEKQRWWSGHQGKDRIWRMHGSTFGNISCPGT